MCSLIKEHNVFENNTEANRGLVNVFTGTQATNEQDHDLLNARKLGQLSYANYITHHIIQSPSIANAPVRCRRLLTMAPRKITKTRISQKEKEEQDIN